MVNFDYLIVLDFQVRAARKVEAPGGVRPLRQASFLHSLQASLPKNQHAGDGRMVTMRYVCVCVCLCVCRSQECRKWRLLLLGRMVTRR
jgi:hypothetical protein